MTLASILVITVLSASTAGGRFAQVETVQFQSDSTSGPSSAPAKQSQNAGSSSASETAGQTSPTAPPTAAKNPSSQTRTGKKPKHKKNLPANCDNTMAQNAEKGSSSSGPADLAAKKAASTTPSRCPPTKVIVRQGSTTEPSIQVVGGAGGSQASDERNTATKMLETTEGNLKQIEGSQLDSNQQEMIKQVRQFMDQSKAASSSGDLDQARTLAWKAQMLSEELLKAQK